jgi:hemoglobin
MSEATLYQRLGGYDAIAAVCADPLPRLQADPLLERFWLHRGIESTRNDMVEC